METVIASVKCLRALRAELLEKQKNERLPAFALCENNVTFEIVKSHELEIRTLANLSSLEVNKSNLWFLCYGFSTYFVFLFMSLFIWVFAIGSVKGRTRSSSWFCS